MKFNLRNRSFADMMWSAPASRDSLIFVSKVVTKSKEPMKRGRSSRALSESSTSVTGGYG